MRLLAFLLFCLALLPCTAALPAKSGMMKEQAACSPENALQDALAVYHILCKVNPLCSQMEHTGSGKDENAPIHEQIHHFTQQIRPHCARLRQLPPEQLKQICMLTDAILWQHDWIIRNYCSEVMEDIAFEWLEWGFEELDICATIINRRLGSPTTTAEEKAAWLELLNELGGVEALSLPKSLLQERWARDYKTALTFYKEFCAAASEQDEATCLQMLKEQAVVVDYLRQNGDLELLRVNELVAAFASALETMKKESPFPRPILSESLRSTTRMQALEPFFTTLPALKPLLFGTK